MLITEHLCQHLEVLIVLQNFNTAPPQKIEISVLTYVG